MIHKSLIIIAVVLFAKILNYYIVGNFRLYKFIGSFGKIYKLRYYHSEPYKIKRYRLVNNVLNIILYTTLLFVAAYIIVLSM